MASYSGIAHLAIITSDTYSALLGHFVVDPTDSCPQRVALGLSGKGCSCEAEDKWYDLTLTNFKEDKEVEFAVRLTGGDYASLASKYLSFTATSIKTDEEAKEHFCKFIKKIPLADVANFEILICIGPMETDLFDFATMTPGERKKLSRDVDEGDRFVHKHQHFHPESVFREKPNVKPGETPEFDHHLEAASNTITTTTTNATTSTSTARETKPTAAPKAGWQTVTHESHNTKQ